MIKKKTKEFIMYSSRDLTLTTLEPSKGDCLSGKKSGLSLVMMRCGLTKVWNCAWKGILVIKGGGFVSIMYRTFF